MGIQGLHAWVKPISQPISLTELKGRTIAVDVSGWLHRGLFACALEVESGQSTDRFLDVTRYGGGLTLIMTILVPALILWRYRPI